MGADLSKPARELWGFSLLDTATDTAATGLTVEPCFSLSSKGLRTQHVALFDYVIKNRHMFAVSTGPGGCLRGFANHLTSVDLSSNTSLGAKGVKALLHESSPLLAENTNTSLFMNEDHREPPTPMMANRFGGISSWLTSVNLSDCGLGDEGAKHVAAAFFRCSRFRRRGDGDSPSTVPPYTPRMPSLRTLLLDRNEIGDDGCAALCEAISSNLMSCIEFHHEVTNNRRRPKNRKGCDQEATTVAVILRNVEEIPDARAHSYFPLKVLSLRQNRITDASAESLQLLISHSVTISPNQQLKDDANVDEGGVNQMMLELSSVRTPKKCVVEIEMVDLFGNHFGNDGLLAVGKSIAQRLTAITELRGGTSATSAGFVGPEALEKLVFAKLRNVIRSSSTHETWDDPCRAQASSSTTTPLRRLTLSLGNNAIDAQGLSYVISSVTEAHESAVLHYLSTIEQLEQCIARGRSAAESSPHPFTGKRRKSRQVAVEGDICLMNNNISANDSIAKRKRRQALRHVVRMLDTATNFSFLRVLDLQGCLLGDDGLMSLFGMVVSFSETSALLGECAGNVIRQIVPNAVVSRYHFPHSLLLLEKLYLGYIGATSFSVDTILALFSCSRAHLTSEMDGCLDHRGIGLGGTVDNGSPTIGGRESICALSPLSAKQKLESRLLRGSSASPAAGRGPRASAVHSIALRRSAARSYASPSRGGQKHRSNGISSTGQGGDQREEGCSCALPFLRVIDLSGNHFGKRGGEVFAQLFLHGLNKTTDCKNFQFECDMQRCQLDDDAVGSALAILRAQLFEQLHGVQPLKQSVQGCVALRIQHNTCSHNALVALRETCGALVENKPLNSESNRNNSNAATARSQKLSKSLTCLVEGNHILFQQNFASASAAVDWSALSTNPLGAPAFEQEEDAPSPALRREEFVDPVAVLSPPLPAFHLSRHFEKDDDAWPSSHEQSASSPLACPPLPRTDTLGVYPTSNGNTSLKPQICSSSVDQRRDAAKASSDELIDGYMAKSGAQSVSAVEIEKLLAEAELLLSPSKQQRAVGGGQTAGLKYTFHRTTASAVDREPFF